MGIALFGQRKKTIVNDQILDERIRTVQLYPGPFEAAYPVLFLNQRNSLVLEFDELIPEDAPETYFYTEIINCDLEWKSSFLLPAEFYQGFSQKTIDRFVRSRNTKVPYVHYQHRFPEQGEYFKRSGNYAINVYRDNSMEELVFSRRFIVVDPQISINLKYLLNPEPERLDMDEFGFEINTERLQNQFPLNDIDIRVLQNFRWDTAFEPERPRFSGDQLFEYFIDINRFFPGGHEFRFHDIRSTRLYGESVRLIEERKQVFDVILNRDKKWRTNTYRPYQDYNGSYLVKVQEWPDDDIFADYVYNFFSLESPSKAPGKVYIMGALTDWLANAENEMTYNAQLGRYEGELLLKQGVYDYTYVVKNGNELDETYFQGARRETENFYTILIYYRSPMDRSVRILGYLPVNYFD